MSSVISEVLKTDQINPCDLLIRYLEEMGVEYIFGIPGGAIEPLYNALAKSERRGGIRAITARHETGAVFMADAYARNTGKLGVCCSTTGPGATNMITGIASSYENNTPLLVITPQASQDKIGKKALQDSSDTGVNIPGMLQFCTRYNSVVTHVDQFEHKLVSAVMAAFGTPNGPAHLSIPVDVMKETLTNTHNNYRLSTLAQKTFFKDEVATKQLVKEVASSKKIVFVVGSGAINTTDIVLRTINTLNAQFVATPDAKGFINPYHHLYRGVFGFAGHETAIETLRDKSVDTIIAIGTSMGEFSSNAWDTSALLNKRLIHIDDNIENLTRSPMAKLQVRGTISTVLESLLQEITSLIDDNTVPAYYDPEKIINKTRFFSQKQSERKNTLPFNLDNLIATNNHSSPIKPQFLMSQLTKLFPSNTHYLADNGNNAAWAIHYLNPIDRRLELRRDQSRDGKGRRKNNAYLFQVCTEFCSMGWSVGSAIGTALAHPNDPVLCIVGDGSFLMSGSEITVAQQENLNVIFLIMNDQHLGMVKHGQRLNKSADIANELPNISYALMASSMGIMSHTIESADDLINLDIKHMCRRKGPVLLDVRIDPLEVPPIATRLKGMR